MKGTTKRQVTIERHTVTIIRTKGKLPPVFCQQCQKPITDLIPEQVADGVQAGSNEVDQPMESELFHLIQTEVGEE